MSRTEEALAALAASRLQLQGALGLKTPREGDEHDDIASASSWRRGVRLVRVLAWQAVPPSWRTWGRLLLSPLSDAATPLVRRHPASAMALAACAGAAVMLIRPWRWRMPSLGPFQHMAPVLGSVGPMVLAWLATQLPARENAPTAPPSDPAT